MPRDVTRASITLAAGLGYSLNMCGALTAASLALGQKYGRYSLEEDIGRKPSWSRGTRLVERFKEEFRTLSCAEITWGFGDFASQERIQRCMGIIDFTTRAVARLLFDPDDTFADADKEAYFSRRERKGKRNVS